MNAFRASKRLTTRFFNASGAKKLHTLPDLPYSVDALQPIISSEIMLLHHSKHHDTYVKNLNKLETELGEAHAAGDVSRVISLAPGIRFNGGGHLNHSIFWTNLSPNGGTPPAKGELKTMIDRDFGSLDRLIEAMSAKTVAIQGSGWGWLGFDRAEGSLRLATCANQDPLEATTGLVPLLGIDVWEHAYYLQYKNVRPDYVKKLWNVVNWDNVEERLNQARTQPNFN